MKTATPPNRPGRTEFAREMGDTAAGIGPWTTTLFGIVPGFLPTVLLTVVSSAVIVIPVLILGGAFGAALGLLLVLGRLIARGFSLLAGDHHEPGSSANQQGTMVRAEPEAALH